MKIPAIALLVVALLAASCGGDSSERDADATDSTTTTEPIEAGGPTATTRAPADATQPAEDASAAEPEPNNSGAGSLELGGETILFDSARCFLQEQDAAAGGGKILFVAQAFGENAAGDAIVIDVSRYDEDSMFTGDDIIVDIGDPFSDDSVSAHARTDLGTVAIDGSSLSANDLVFVDSTDLSERSGSFQINC